MTKKENKLITVFTRTANVEFCGHYRRELEKDNWHYYETELGKLLHFRKSEMICVLEGAEWSIT